MTDLINTIITTRTKLIIQLMRQGDDLETAINNTEHATNHITNQAIQYLQQKQQQKQEPQDEGWKA